MSRKISKTRRDFLKTSMGAAAVALVTNKIDAAQKLSKPKVKIINPAIDNLRVVCCHDPDMVTGDPTTFTTISGQNEPVVVEKVQANMDQMAMELAEKPTPQEAWATIFQKPASKEWPEVKVAIKANCKTLNNNNNPMNNPRLAVLDKVCKALNGLGIPYGNIILYDDDDEDATIYNNFVGNGLPDGIVVSTGNDALGGQKISTLIPAPYNQNGNCTKHIADGTIDILINCAMNKGHDSTWGNATSTMKNHLGTFSPQPHNTDRLIGISKSDAIIGGTPTRQQLCIVDSIWASMSGPSAIPDKAPYRLVMGTCSPVVDYATIIKIREDVMGASHTSSVVNRFLTDFGYSPDDLDFVNVDPVPINFNNQSAKPKKITTLHISLPKSFSKVTNISFDLTSEVRPIFINIHNLKGRRIRSLPLSKSSSGNLNAIWDGCDRSGARVGSGSYLVTVIQNGRSASKKIELVK